MWQSQVNVFAAKIKDEKMVVSETQKRAEKAKKRWKHSRHKDLKKHKQRKGRNTSTEK